MVWSPDGWLRTEDGQGLPQVSVPAPNLPPHPLPAPPRREEFDSPELPIDFQWLRTPHPERLWSLTQRPGFLRLFGRETLGSQFEQALVARRQQAHCFTASTRMEFEPVATSTFEWYPAVQIHHSRDLVHWRLLTRPLRRAGQLDMRGDPDSCGVWAPCPAL